MPSSDTSSHPATTAFTAKAKDADAVALVTTNVPAPTAAFAGTVVVIEVALLVVMLAVTPPILTEAPVKPDPLIITVAPADADAGVTCEMVGADGATGEELNTEKENNAGASPGTVTTTPPPAAVAPAGTLVVMVVPVLLEMPAAWPPMVTFAPAKLAPFIVTWAPD